MNSEKSQIKLVLSASCASTNLYLNSTIRDFDLPIDQALCPSLSFLTGLYSWVAT
jgi:hypothetical protein